MGLLVNNIHLYGLDLNNIIVTIRGSIKGIEKTPETNELGQTIIKYRVWFNLFYFTAPNSNNQLYFESRVLDLDEADINNIYNTIYNRLHQEFPGSVAI